MSKGKIFVALSGGVDSAVSAYLLKQDGYDVVGVHMKGWTAPGVACSESEDRQDATRVAAKLGIPFYALDTADDYERLVLTPFLRDYAGGLTPNPDVLCNSQIKFGVFAKFARDSGADAIATGHYARIKDGMIINGKDTKKDQTYFLWQTPLSSLPMIRFPVGDLDKSEVRRIAQEAGLSVAEKKDSQGVCFIGELDMPSFLRTRIPSVSGDILNEQGKKIGEHDGVTFFTRGQRHGIGVSAAEPYYVASRDIKTNTLTVVTGRDNPLLMSDGVVLSSVHKLNDLSMEKDVYAQIRYRGERHAVSVNSKTDGTMLITTTNNKFWAPERGQSCVLYKKEGGDFVLMGGGVISEYF